MSMSQAQRDPLQSDDDNNYSRILLDFINQCLPLLPSPLNQKLTGKDMDQLLPEHCKHIVSLMFRGKTACDLKDALSSPSLGNKIQRVSELITEYDEDCCRSPNPALDDFVQKIKVILNSENEITRMDGTNYADAESNRNDNAAASSSSGSGSGFLPQIDVGDSNSNNNPKVIQALGNHDVLTEIFKCGNLCELKNFRLVNKQWKGIANSTIIQRRLWKLNIKDTFGGSNSNGNEALLKLNNCIAASEGSFPLTTLEFSDVKLSDYDNLNSVALSRFYGLITLIGQSIKRVVFNNFGPVTINDLRDLLVNKMPNVDQIDIGEVDFHEEECQLPIDLPNLKTINFVTSYFNNLPYYKILLLAAKNLKNILNFHRLLTDIVIDTGKMDCIQTFQFVLQTGGWGLDYRLVKYSHTKPKLASLNFTISSIFYRRPDRNFKLCLKSAEALKRILISSKDTLKHLQCMPGVFPVDFTLPQFPNLEILTVSDSYFDLHADSALGFPPGCDCSEIFPKVHTVLLDIDIDRTFDTSYKHSAGQEFPSVKTVEFQKRFDFTGRSVKMVFPNVSLIRIVGIVIPEWVADWNHEGINFDLENQIESLEFHQCRLGRREFLLDSLFTGFPRGVCANLLGMYSNRKARGEDEGITKVKTILEAVHTPHCMFRNSEGLRRLRITFNHKGNVDFRVPFTSDGSGLESEDNEKEVKSLTPTAGLIITPVSCVYGFSLMPDLEEVIIGFDHTLPNAYDIAQVFKPFAQFPFVKIVHSPTDWNDYPDSDSEF